MKKIICLFLGLLFFIGILSSGFAKVRLGHDSDLENVFFGKKISPNDIRYETFSLLEDAVWLCLDQTVGEGQDVLDKLNNSGVQGLPKKVSEISLPGGPDHQKYSHKGWDYDYPGYKTEWGKRKIILLATVSWVFDFPVDNSKTGEDCYSEECKALAKLLYCIHVIGDLENDTQKTQRNPLQLADGLLKDIRGCITVLFRGQKTSNKYCMLIVKLNSIRFLEFWHKSDDNAENRELPDKNNYLRVSNRAKRTLEILKMYLPGLFIGAPFFIKAFPTN